MNVEAGQVLSGTLRFVRKIADGGMGSVWLAEHLVLNTEVAVKVLARPWAAMPSAATRFVREARITAKIRSPHVVRVLDCRCDESDEPYLVLELLRGENLEERVRRAGALSVFELLEVVAQTCEALTAAHEAGYVHRDLKPENVFLVAGRQPFVKLLDFGVAKPTDDDECIDADRLPAGTPQYMSPEHMFEPQDTDARSDLFSLGAVAYFALTGRSPFEADSLEGLYFAIDGGRFERPSELRPELPASLDPWFAKALAHDPGDRFQTAREMAEALRAALEGRRTARPALRIPAEPRGEAPNDEPPAVALSTLGEIPGVPRQRTRTRLAAVALAAAALVLAWQTAPELQAATSAPSTQVPEAGVQSSPAVEIAAHPEDAGPPPPRAPEVRVRRAPRSADHRRATRTDDGSAAEESRACEPIALEQDASGVTIEAILGAMPNPNLAPAD
jgi:eukaryotic-like serine/threonine-protein kinase